MPEWVWIIIAVIGGGIAIAASFVFLRGFSRRGGKIGVGTNTFVLHGESTSNGNPLSRALRYVPDNIGLIASLVYSHYLWLVKQKGVEPGVMTELEDARFARQVIRVATSLGNGSNSVQKILETDIANRDWEWIDIDRHIQQSVLPRVTDALRSTINSEYDTVARYAEHSDRQRIVTQAEFVDMLSTPRFQHELTERLEPFYMFARHCLDTGCPG